LRGSSSAPLVAPALIETFAHGWAQLRGLPPPTQTGCALRIETGQAHERRRYIFPDPPGDIAALAAMIDEPLILLKAAIDPEQMAEVLPPRWHVEQTGTTMTINRLAPHALSLSSAFTLDSDWHGPVFSIRIVEQDGTEAAHGRLTLVDGWAQHDSIAVAERYQRRGLGTAVMAALALEARACGVDRGLLNATIVGRALYQQLGWVAHAPWTTAQIRA
jgi:GNAT superfamily N-acetyltransferase